jgi:alpha-L-fucosidase
LTAWNCQQNKKRPIKTRNTNRLKLLAGGNIKVKSVDENLVMEVPATAPDAIASVIKVELKGKVANVNNAAKSTMKTGELE